MREEKEIVKEFYNSFGWHTNADGVYKDTATFVDIRPVLDSYSHKTHMRVKEFIMPRGEYFLDAGSGAISHPEYLEYSSGYRWHVCIDISQRALVEAQAKLRDRGLYVIADVTRLPFKDGVFDAVVSAHVLYHVPADEQASAVLELQRTMNSGGSCVIIYTWPTCLLTRIARLFNAPGIIARVILKKIPGTRSLWRKMGKSVSEIRENEKHEGHNRPQLYFHPHDRRWFQRTFPDDWNMDIRCWRSVDTTFTKTFVPNNLLGQLLMRFIFWFELVFPRTSVRIGKYPIIIIRKS